MLQHDTAFSMETLACALGPAASLCSSAVMNVRRAVGHVGPGHVQFGAQLAES